MDIALQAESAAAKPTTFKAVIDILAEAGYDAEGSLKPITKNHKFYWYKTYNTIVLANHEETTAVVVYPTKNEELANAFATDLAKTGDAQVLFSLEAGFRQFVEVSVTDAKAAAEALDNGQSMALTQDVVLTKPVAIPEGADTTLDLGGNAMSTPKNESSGRSDYLDVYGTLTIENGTFNGRGIQVRAGGKLIIGKDANIVINSVDTNGGAAIWVYEGGEVIIEGGKFISPNAGAEASGAAALINDGGTVTIKGGEFVSKTGAYAVQNFGGTMTIENATVSGTRGALYASGGVVTVNGGNFAVTADRASGWCAIAEGSGKIVINGGTFTAVTSRMFTGNVEDKR